MLRARIVVRSKASHLAVRLCDVFPSGASALVSYGVLNLCHLAGHTLDKVVGLTRFGARASAGVT